MRITKHFFEHCNMMWCVGIDLKTLSLFHDVITKLTVLSLTQTIPIYIQ